MKIIQKILNQEIAIAKNLLATTSRKLLKDSAASGSIIPSSPIKAYRVGRSYKDIDMPRFGELNSSKAAFGSSSMLRSAVLLNDIAQMPTESGLGAKQKLLAELANSHLVVNKKINSGVFLYAPLSDNTCVRMEMLSSRTHSLHSFASSTSHTQPSSISNSYNSGRAEDIQTSSRVQKQHSASLTEGTRMAQKLKSLLVKSQSRKPLIKQLNLTNVTMNAEFASSPTDTGEKSLLLVTRMTKDERLNASRSLPRVRELNALNGSTSRTNVKAVKNYDYLASLLPSALVNLVVGYYLRH